MSRWGLVGLASLALSCGGGSGTAAAGAERSARGEPAGCRPLEEPAHPSYRSERLTLELRDPAAGRDLGGVTLPPFEFEVQVDEDLPGPVPMELTILDPQGGVHTQRFSFENMRERCDPHCLPVRSRADCPPRHCWPERHRPPAQRIDPAVYRVAIPGTWTFVLHRLDDDDRVSVAQRLFEGARLGEAEAEECEALPVELGGFRRVSCQPGVVPTGTQTRYWGLSARYERGACRVRAFALPLNDAVRTAFDEGPYRAGTERALPEGVVREVELEGTTARAWLAHHHLYVLGAADGVGGFDGVVRALLAIFPVVDGPARAVPSCAATGAVSAHVMPPTTMDAIRGEQASFHTHFEGNRPSGARALFHDRHPLAWAGLRRQEIVHTVDGAPIRNRAAFLAALERLTRPGQVELVVSRSRVRHARCLRVTIDPSASVPPPVVGARRAPPPPPPPPPPTGAPRIGRHCERRSDSCWDCAELPFPFEVGCAGCGRDLCVRVGGAERCLPPTRVCCLPNEPCDRPPGCEGAASSCSTAVAGGRNERCTFLSECAQPLPSSARAASGP